MAGDDDDHAAHVDQVVGPGKRADLSQADADGPTYVCEDAADVDELVGGVGRDELPQSQGVDDDDEGARTQGKV